jgi:hypothetical protein
VPRLRFAQQEGAGIQRTVKKIPQCAEPARPGA